jgi:hypothetical protein
MNRNFLKLKLNEIRDFQKYDYDPIKSYEYIEWLMEEVEEIVEEIEKLHIAKD